MQRLSIAKQSSRKLGNQTQAGARRSPCQVALCQVAGVAAELEYQEVVSLGVEMTRSAID